MPLHLPPAFAARSFPHAAFANVPIVRDLPNLYALLPGERSHALGLAPRRRAEWVAGRGALRTALLRAGCVDPPELLPDAWGRPCAVPGWTASLSHKADLAVAVAAPCVEGWTLGIDLEERGRPRPSIATRVLRPEELARWEADGSSWERLLELFSVKEAIYKALHPHVPRWIGFDEAEIGADGTAVFFPRGDEPRVELRVDFAWDRSRLLCMAAARPLAAG